MNATTCELGSQIIEAGAHSTSALYRLVKLSASFDESVEWALDGMPTAAHWIARALDVEVSTAREWIRIGKALGNLPKIDAAFSARQVSYSKVRALTRFATKENEQELLELAKETPAGRLGRVLAGWSMKNQDPEEIEQRQYRERGLFASTYADGSLVATLRLPALAGGKLMAVVDTVVMSQHDASADASLAQRRADGLVALLTDGPAEIITELVVHLRSDGASFDDGTPIVGSIVERIAPTSFLRALIHDAQGHPINASGRHRHPTQRQKRLVKERDRSCVDCGSEDFLQYDHVPDFSQSQHTVVDELQLRCSRCHRRRHETTGWQTEGSGAG